jgi:hypothetical protein
MMKSDVNPMHSAHSAPRCTATAKRSGQRCKSPAVNGWSVCRMHGAGGGHPRGPSHPRYKHGGRSLDMIEMRRLSILLSINGIDGA